MAKAKCPKCDWETVKADIGKAEQSLKMHIGRKHKGIGPQKGQPRAAKTITKRKYNKKAVIAVPDDSAAELAYLRRENQRLKETIMNLVI